MCEGLSKISSNFTLHLIKVGKLKRFKKVSSDLKTILKTHLRFLELWERRNMSINLNYAASENSLKLTWSKKEEVVCEALFYLTWLKFTCLEIFLSLFMLLCKDYQYGELDWIARACAILHKSWRHVRLKLPSPRKSLHHKFPSFLRSLLTPSSVRLPKKIPVWEGVIVFLFFFSVALLYEAYMT